MITATPGQFGVDDLGRPQAVHVGHIDVHQHDIRLHHTGFFDRLGAGSGGIYHLDIALEHHQLGKVIARLGDIVYDHHPDLLLHAITPFFAGWNAVYRTNSSGKTTRYSSTRMRSVMPVVVSR